MRDMVERFWAKVEIGDDCWEWQGSITASGYGQIQRPRKVGGPIGAHRFSAMLHFGMFDTRLYVLHRCDNRRCVNPDHLYLGTHADNMRDLADRKRSSWLRKTHCPNGHEYSEQNTRIYQGRRYCKTCPRERYVPKPKRHECKRGHALTRDNSYIRPDGGRSCRACARLRGNAYAQGMKAGDLTSG